MDRRVFLTWMGIGWMASCLPVALAACASKETTSTLPDSTSTAAMPGGFRPVGTVADLDRSGSILSKAFKAGPILVIRDPSNSKKLVAASATCTHKGCQVAWQSTKKAFVCPCHQAQFSATGQVIKGPAKEPLKTYAVKLDGNRVLVSDT